MKIVVVFRLVFLSAGAMAYTGQASAQSDGASARVMATFETCRKLTQADPRAACFDRAALALQAAIDSKDVRILDRADIRLAKRTLFGFTIPRIGLLSSDGRDEFTELNTTVSSTRPAANNRYEIRLTDQEDAVWQTTDPMNFPPRSGDKIRIRKGALGNYFMTVDGVSYRGTRLR
ncbi:MAG: hypothetical protein ABIS14_06265 [Sphingomonas sp.]